LYPLRLTRGSIVLLFICTLDMLTTLYFVTHGFAVEINPIMNTFFRISPFAFVAAKLISFIPFIVAIELYKKHNARFTSMATRFTIVAYSVVYVVATVGANRA